MASAAWAVTGLGAGTAFAAGSNQFGAGGPGADHVVFVQTDNPAGNQIVAYHRSGGGALTWAATYLTGGQGGVLAGSVVDHLASQGSLAYEPAQRLPGTVDASASVGGHYLYVQTGGSGVVDEFRVGPSGSLTEIGSVTVPGAVGGEGIVAR